ncbi:type IX secretion system sortase PorU [soil metagenome]
MFSGVLAAHAQPSVLSSGKWYKLSVANDGVYKIDYELLKKIGINPDVINPQNIKLYGGVNGMLPQANSTARINDLQQIGIYLKGADDEKFNRDDYILFYGQGPDAYQLIPSKGIFQFQNNIYADKNYYFISVGTNAGKRMPLTESIGGILPSVNEFDYLSYYESEKTNELHSGRDWFGEQFDSKTEYTIRFEIAGIVQNSLFKVVSSVMGQSFAKLSKFQVFVNDFQIGEQGIDTIFNSQYSVKGFERTDTLIVNSAVVGAPSRTNQDIKIKFVKAASGRSVGYLDYILLHTKRVLALYGDQTIFQSIKSLGQPASQFTINLMPSGGFVWDVTDAFNASVQQSVINGTTCTFGANSSSLRKYVAVSDRNYPAPVSEGEVPNQDIHSISSVDMLIVTPREFILEAERLATHRESVSSIKVEVITTDEIYNEFSSGKQDVTAIRDAVRYLYSKGSGIKNLLLFGRGSYDYKNYLTFNKNFVPIYQSRNSLSPLETYSSDDYFGFLELNEGNWGEDPVENHTLDIGVGRLPIRNIEDAKIMVDKIIQYETKTYGEWRKEILFVADDGDFNLHQTQTDEMAEDLERDHPEFNAQKLYLDAFKQFNTKTGQSSPDAIAELSNSVRKGVIIVNYTGHGGEQQLTQERIVDQITLDTWKTNPNYPLMVTATCEFGRNDDPGIISTAELFLFRKGGGSIGLLTTARPVGSSTNFTLNKAFYQALFIKDQGNFRDLGSITRDTKNNSISGVSNRNFSLLGDPSLKIPLPTPELKVTEIKNLSSASDTLKALSKIRVRGSVYSNGVPVTNYDGTLVATLFDKPTKEITKGDENSPFQFKGRDNAMFRGQARIRNGAFEFEFIVPSSIDRVVGAGKLAMYASSKTDADVTAAQSILKIGSLEKNPGVDTKGPGIELFMGDSTFVNGGVAGKSSRIVAILTDQSGINTSIFNPQKAITVLLDDSLTYIVSKYYQSDVDNPLRGKVNYPVENLKPGNHRVELRASDTFGNTSSTVIVFTVSDKDGIQIEQWFNYPNPVIGNTTFRFKHNRSGEDLEAVVTVYDPLGQPVANNTYQINSSPYQVDLPEWDATAYSGTKLGPGLYLLKLSVRSLLDGSKNDKITKVIIAN